MHHPTDRITHTTAFVTPVVEHWLERETDILSKKIYIRWSFNEIYLKNNPTMMAYTVNVYTEL